MTEYDKKYPLTAPRKGGKGGATNIFEIGLITDLDKDAKCECFDVDLYVHRL